MHNSIIANGGCQDADPAHSLSVGKNNFIHCCSCTVWLSSGAKCWKTETLELTVEHIDLKNIYMLLLIPASMSSTVDLNFNPKYLQRGKSSHFKNKKTFFFMNYTLIKYYLWE